MPFSVHITTPRPSRELSIKRLRVPKARQKELSAIINLAWERNACLEEAPADDAIESGKMDESASAA
jgi:hypothetical protein